MDFGVASRISDHLRLVRPRAHAHQHVQADCGASHATCTRHFASTLTDLTHTIIVVLLGVDDPGYSVHSSDHESAAQLDARGFLCGGSRSRSSIIRTHNSWHWHRRSPQRASSLSPLSFSFVTCGSSISPVSQGPATVAPPPNLTRSWKYAETTSGTADRRRLEVPHRRPSIPAECGLTPACGPPGACALARVLYGKGRPASDVSQAHGEFDHFSMLYLHYFRACMLRSCPDYGLIRCSY